ncbi:MAG: hypothetical protein LVT47_13475 [Cyanobacteria bacterium LVE1205-1]|jgi:outer membrane protein assembly factor BamB
MTDVSLLQMNDQQDFMSLSVEEESAISAGVLFFSNGQRYKYPDGDYGFIVQIRGGRGNVYQVDLNPGSPNYGQPILTNTGVTSISVT